MEIGLNKPKGSNIFAETLSKDLFVGGRVCIYVTWPGKTGLIYTKYTCLYYGMYLLFCMCYPKSVNFIEFLMDFCIYGDILDTIQITDKKLLHVKLSKSGQIVCVDKTCFPRPSHIFCYLRQIKEKIIILSIPLHSQNPY